MLGLRLLGFRLSERHVNRLTGMHPTYLRLVGQSTLLNKCTHTASEAAAYEFTTLTVRHYKAGPGLARLIHQR